MDDGRDLVEEMQQAGAAQRRAEAAQRKLDLAAYRAQGVAKPRKRGTPERDTQRAVVKWLRLCGCLVSATINEQRSASDDPAERARYGAARKASGATTGWPDLTVALPAGRVVFIELKSGVGRLSEAQRAVHAWLRENGHLVLVATTVEAVQMGLAAAGIVVGARSSRLHLAAPVDPL